MRRGMASFHHPLTLHGSDSNVTARPTGVPTGVTRGLPCALTVDHLILLPLDSDSPPPPLLGTPSWRSPRPRRAVALNTVLDGTRSNYELSPPTGRFPFIPQGEPLGRSGHENDRFYPLLLGADGCAEAGGPGADFLAGLPRSPRPSR